MSDRERKKLKTGLKKGGGPPPGYLWNVKFLSMAQNDSHRLLTKAQFEHFLDQFKDLASCDEPLKCPLMKIDQIGDFHELKDKGGVLGNKSFRIFFGLDKSDKDNHSIIILGVSIKKTNGKTPPGTKTTMQRRWDNYLKGDYSYDTIISKHEA